VADSAVYSQLDAAADAVAAQVIAWRQHLHQNPELSNREVNTAALISDHLGSLGLDEVRTGIAGHGVVGVLKGGQPGDRVIALRADIDALPVTDECGAPYASTVTGSSNESLARPVRKPLYSREGANVTLVSSGTTIEQQPGPYGSEGFIRQAFAPLPRFAEQHPVIGSWIVGDRACGLSIREDANPITGNTSRFLPHAIL